MRSTVRELFDEVAAHLSLKDKEDYFFGLAVKIGTYVLIVCIGHKTCIYTFTDDEEWFMEQHKKLKKYAPPGWKDQVGCIDINTIYLMVFIHVRFLLD